MDQKEPQILGFSVKTLFVTQNTICWQYFSCQLSFCCLLIRLIKRNNSMSFCVYSVFLGDLMGFHILLGTHSHFIFKHINIEQNLGAGQETWNGLLVFICSFKLAEYQRPSTVWLKPVFSEWNFPQTQKCTFSMIT